jgi:hypothetical protein
MFSLCAFQIWDKQSILTPNVLKLWDADVALDVESLTNVACSNENTT